MQLNGRDMEISVKQSGKLNNHLGVMLAIGQMKHLRKRKMTKVKNNFYIKGISLLEAIVSTAIIGIGFVAILQMTNYSVSSIGISSERTKANFLTNMIAEDTLGNRSTGITGDNFSEKMIALLTLSQSDTDAGISMHDLSASCSKGGAKDTNSGNIYGTYTPGEIVAASDMKYRKWGAILNSKDYMNCKGTNETRKFQIFKLSPSWGSGDVENNSITDDIMYIGKIQIKLNDGKKTNFLYFQADYKLKGLNENQDSGNQDGDPLNAQQQDGG